MCSSHTYMIYLQPMRFIITLPILASREFHLSVTVNNLFDVIYIDHLSTLKGLKYNNMGRNIIFRIRFPFGVSL